MAVAAAKEAGLANTAHIAGGIDAWKKAGAEGLKRYKAGSEGPVEAEELMKRDGRSWRKLS